MDFCAQNRFNCGFRNPRTFPETRLRGMIEGSATGLRAVISKGSWMMKGQRRPGNGFDLSEAPSHLIRRCQQFYGDLYAREAGGKELTKQQFTLLCALEQNDGASQTALVEITGIDRSTLAEMVRRMLEKGLLSRERTEEDARANAVAISPSGRKALRGARNAADRAERALLEALPQPERQKFVKALSQIAQAAEQMNGDASKPVRRNVRRRKLGG
jgi:DNA-binding MarR family transcriptional regulator